MPYQTVTMSAMTATDFDRRAIPAGAETASWVAADGWAHRIFQWNAEAARGTILFVGGRGDFFEKYLELFGHFHARSWSVESLDWRGQGGSGRLVINPRVGHAIDFGHWVDDLAAFLADRRQSLARPLVVVAHSMGGHLALRALAERKIAPDKLVLVAPMLGIADPIPPWFGSRIARIGARFSSPEQTVWKSGEKPLSSLAERKRLLTGCDDRYADEQYWWTAKPELPLGPANWQWIAAAYASFAKLAEPGLLEAIETPVLVLAASGDKLVSTAAIRRVTARLRNRKLVEFPPPAAHELLREADPVRSVALQEIDAFLDDKQP